MAWLAPTSTCFTCAGRISCNSINRIISVIAGWLSDPDGYGFSEIPGAAKFHGAPCLPRFGHRTEILTQSGGLTRRDAERIEGLLKVEPQQFRASGRGSKRTAG